jgi:hypothetical protein
MDFSWLRQVLQGYLIISQCWGRTSVRTLQETLKKSVVIFET